MPEIAVSPLLPTVTVTVVSALKVVPPSTEAVTRAVLAPPSSATLLCTSSLSVSASTDKVMEVGVASSSLIVPVAVMAVPEKVALVGEVSCTRKVLSGSSITSWVVATMTVVVVDPAAIVTVSAVVTGV